MRFVRTYFIPVEKGESNKRLTRVARLYGKKNLRVQTQDYARPGSDEVLLRIAASAAPISIIIRTEALALFRCASPSFLGMKRPATSKSSA